MFRKKENQAGKYQPEFLDKILFSLILLALAVLALAVWYKNKYYNALKKNSQQENYILQLERHREDLLKELKKYRD